MHVAMMIAAEPGFKAGRIFSEVVGTCDPAIQETQFQGLLLDYKGIFGWGIQGGLFR
jgi:hypothetical protein